MQYRIVRASRDRAEEIARVFRESFRATYPDFPALHSAGEDVAFVRDHIFETDEVYAAEATETETLLGFVAFNREFIDLLYLVPAAQKRGIGSRLLEVARRNADRLLLWTFQQNRAARSFYEKHGFREIKETDGSETEEKQPDVLLEWVRAKQETTPGSSPAAS